MYEIKQDVINTFIEKKSKFICRLFKVYNENDAKDKIKNIEKIEKGATHNCYAYRIYTKNSVIERKSDAKEPHGTAGAPMLSILANEQLINILAITTRYFGGIKLGTGGLVTAYKKSVIEALKLTERLEFVLKEEKIIKFNISNIKLIESILKNQNIDIKTKNFLQEEVEYIIKISEEEALLLKEKLSQFIISLDL